MALMTRCPYCDAPAVHEDEPLIHDDGCPELVDLDAIDADLEMIAAEPPNQHEVRNGRSGRGVARWDADACVTAIQTWARKHGRPPKSQDTKGDAMLPSPATAREHVGSWADLIERAGFPRPKRGGGQVSTARPKAPPQPGERQQPPAWIRVRGTGLAYRTSMEAYVAADEIEADGERVAGEARRAGHDGKADQAIDAARELAEKIRAAARKADGEPGAGPDPVTPPPAERDGSLVGLARRVEEARSRRDAADRDLRDAVAALRDAAQELAA